MKHKLMALLMALVMAASTVIDVPVLSDAFTVTAQAASAVSKPVASLKSGTYSASASKQVKLTCSTKKATIYYSVNGAAYKKYTSALKISKNTTLKVYAKYNGKKSSVVTYTYKLVPKITASLKGGEYEGAQNVKLTTKLKNVKLYYTLDGTKPTKKSTPYTKAGINITDSCKLRVLAVKSGWSSKYYTYNYSIISNESILEDITQKYYYNAMTDKQKKIYKALYDGLCDRKTSINLTDLHVAQWELDYVWWLFTYDNPHLYWANTTTYNYNLYYNNEVCDVFPSYYVTDANEIKKLGKRIDAVLQPIIEEARKQPDNYSTVLYLHDALCDMAEYQLTNKYEQCSIVGTALENKAQCEGYAKTFMYLCQSVGIPAVVITGTSYGEDHAWNRLQLDGKWYLFDVTWDDTNSSYDYFGLTDAQMEAANHNTGTWFPMEGAQANSTDYNYYLREGITVHTTAKKAYDALVKAAVSNYYSGVKTTAVYCEPEQMDALVALISNNINDDLFQNGITHNGCQLSWGSKKMVLEIT